MGAVAIRLREPIFESQTKNKLGNVEIRSDLVAKVKQIVFEQLNPTRYSNKAYRKIEVRESSDEN